MPVPFLSPVERELAVTLFNAEIDDADELNDAVLDLQALLATAGFQWDAGLPARTFNRQLLIYFSGITGSPDFELNRLMSSDDGTNFGLVQTFVHTIDAAQHREVIRIDMPINGARYLQLKIDNESTALDESNLGTLRVDLRAGVLK